MRTTAAAKQFENTGSASRVELSERVIEQDERSVTYATKCSCFEQAQGDRGRTLLAGRAEPTERVGIEHELQVVAMRASVRQAPPKVRLPVSRQ